MNVKFDSLMAKLAATIAPQWWPRALLVRRAMAVAALLAALVLAVWPDPTSTTRSVVVAAHDLQPGQQLSESDVRLRPAAHATIGQGALTTLHQAEGQILSGAAREGEILTDLRLAGPALLDKTGTDRVAVPLRLADVAVAELVHPGSRVDIVGADRQEASGDGGGQVLATDATVLAIRGHDDTTLTNRGENKRLVLVSLPAANATRVASASLRQDVTITLR